MQYTTAAVLPRICLAATSTKLSARQRGASTPDLRAAPGQTLLVSAHASQARTLFSQMIIYRFYPAHASCPFSDLPFPTRGLAPADDGLQGIVPAEVCLECAAERVRRQCRLSATLPSPSALRQSRLSGEPPPQSPSARHILDSHLLQSTAAFSTCSPGFAAKFWTSSCLSHQTNVPSSSKSCAALRLRSLSIVFRPLRLGATLNLLCHGCLRSSHHPFKLPCIMTVSNANGRCASVSKTIHSSAVNALDLSINVARLEVCTVAHE